MMDKIINDLMQIEKEVLMKSQDYDFVDYVIDEIERKYKEYFLTYDNYEEIIKEVNYAEGVCEQVDLEHMLYMIQMEKYLNVDNDKFFQFLTEDLLKDLEDILTVEELDKAKTIMWNYFVKEDGYVSDTFKTLLKREYFISGSLISFTREKEDILKSLELIEKWTSF